MKRPSPASASEPPQRDRPPARHVLVGRVCLAVAAVGVAMLMGEGAFRLFGLAPWLRAIDTSDPGSAYKRSENPILGYELKASYLNPDADLIGGVPRTNSHGQRDVDRAIEKPAGVRRVILLGDSVVESMEVRDIEQVMHRQLERLYPANTVEVLNFGVNGYCTLAEIELLRVKGLAFKPDVVLVVFVHNDFRNFNLAMHAFASRPPRPAAVDALFRHSHLFRATCVRLDLYGFAGEANPLEWNADAIGENNVVAGLAMLRELADREGFTPAIAVWPHFGEDEVMDGPRIDRVDDQLVIEQLAAYHGIPAFRLSPVFARDYAARDAIAGPMGIYTIGDGMHANEEGSRVAALALKSVLDVLDEPSHAVPVAPSEAGYALALARVRELLQQDGGVSVDRRLLRVDEIVSRGKALADAGRLEGAEQMYARAIAIDPELTTDAGNERGNALVALGRMQEAIAQYRDVLQRAPDFVEARYNLGAALDAAGKKQEAIEHYQYALRLNPDLAPAHDRLGITYAQSGRFVEAARHFEEAVRLNPASNEARANLRAVKRMLEDGDKGGGPLTVDHQP